MLLKMKSCPSCERTFSDLSLSYCLHDGSLLSAPFNSDEYQGDLFSKTEAFDREIETVVSKPSHEKITPLPVALEGNRIKFGDNFSVTFERTLRIPDDGNTYPLPPGLGAFPICKVSDYSTKVPAEWNRHGGVFIPLYQREALWLDFDAADWRPNAIKIAAGKINAVTGASWNQSISADEQDYLVCPPQEWIDGFKTGAGIVRQFVAVPLGQGYSVAEQLTGSDEFGGLQIIVFDPKAGFFPEREPEMALRSIPDYDGPLKSVLTEEMGLAAGGKIKQKIYPDPHGAETWDETTFGRLYVHIVNSTTFTAITGLAAPSTPVSAETYTKYGLPWFDLYDEHLTDLPVREELYTVKPVGLMDKIKGVISHEEPLSIKETQIKKVRTDSNKIKDGDW